MQSVLDHDGKTGVSCLAFSPDGIHLACGFRNVPEVVCWSADFGLAQEFESSQLSGLTLQGDIGGTPAFMPPEQVTHYRDVGPAADQYATAATLYFLLTGQYAYDFGKEAGRRLVQLLTEDPIPVRSRRNDLPESLAAVIHRAMNHEPRRRFPTIEHFRMALLALG